MCDFIENQKNPLSDWRKGPACGGAEESWTKLPGTILLQYPSMYKAGSLRNLDEKKMVLRWQK